MKKLLMLSVLAACGESVVVIKGINGKDGEPGANGHSLVSEYVEASLLECPVSSGSRLDVYVDLDDSLSVSEGDMYNGSLVVCNGAQGLQGVAGEQGPQGVIGPQGLQGITGANGQDGAMGAQGPQGLAGPVGAMGAQGIQGIPGTPGTNATASIQAGTSGCVNVVGNYYLKGNTLYNENDSNLCDGNHDKVSMNSSGDSLWLSSTVLAVDDGSTLRVIKFN